eukprot:5444201-Heterocapsa_arctica.AAC.1
MTTISNVTLWRNTATLLQRDPGATWVDHCPVVVDCWFRTWYTLHPSSDSKPWDLPRMTHELRDPRATTTTTTRIDQWAASEQVVTVMERAVEEKNLERAWTLLNNGLSRFSVDYRKQYDQNYNTADTELTQL